MQILIVAATQAEIQPLLNYFNEKKPFDVLITGVGMVATAYALGNKTSISKYDLTINLGIAGSFDKNIALGEVVNIQKDCLSELGAEDGDYFIDIQSLGFGESIYENDADINYFSNRFNLKKVSAITVNTVHGNEGSILKISQQLHPQLESMEGAAFFYACQHAGIMGLQIRAVSNYIEKRNRDNWNIALAIKNLNNFAIQFIEDITQ